MTRDEAEAMLAGMRRDFDKHNRCPMCEVSADAPHLRNCLWAREYNGLVEIMESATKAPPPMEGPNLLWGDPCGTYELEHRGAYWFLKYHAKQPSGFPLQIVIPLSEQALAEMQGMLNMVSFDFKVGIPDGRISGRC